MSQFYCWTCRRAMAAGWQLRHLASVAHLRQVLRRSSDPTRGTRHD